MPFVVAIINQKGGTGKTTTTINLGAGLAYQGYRTLLVDMDPQGHTSIGIGIDPDSFTESMSEVMTIPRKDIEDVVLATYIRNLFVAPSHIKLARAAELLYSRMYRETILYQALKDTNYDYVLIDCPPALGVLTTNSLYVAEFIAIPCQMSRYSLDGLADLLTTIEEVKNISTEDLFRGDFFRILLTMYDRRNRITNEFIMEQLKPYLEKTFGAIIMKNEALNQAQISQKAIFDYDHSSTGARDYYLLTQEFLNLCQKRKSLPEKRQSSLNMP
jgi:chromosome partitioning protein